VKNEVFNLDRIGNNGFTEPSGKLGRGKRHARQVTRIVNQIFSVPEIASV
jgi:hypothetical protein